MLRMRRYALIGLTALLALGLPALRPLGADAPTYRIQDLESFAGHVPVPTGINASGEISGYISTDSGPRAVRYRDGAWSYVPGLESVMSVANGINDHGDLTGYAFTPSGYRAFRFVEGTGLDVIEPLSGGTVTIGMAINNNGEVVGYGNTPEGNRGWRAPVGSPATALPTLGGTFGLACGINDAGQITGTSSLEDGTQHAYRLDVDNTILDLQSVEGPTGTTMACAIDADGHVAGRSTQGANWHPFVYTSAITDIDGFGTSIGSAESTNSGTTVGWFSAADGTNHAFVHTRADGTLDLNSRIPEDSGWVLNQARAINASGQIAGTATVGGEPRAFLLTPEIPPDRTPPAITALVANPSSITPPNKAMVPVALSVTVSDDRDQSPVCTLSSITGPAGDSAITGALSGTVRATGGATYVFSVTCVDAATNHSEATVTVVVPPDRTPPAIASVTVTPSTIWPPNNAMVAISVSATATDDSAEAPVCKLDSITSAGAPAGDALVTGTNTGSVRAVGGRVYTATVVCTDGSGNSSSGTATVTVPRDTTAPTITSLSVNPSSIFPPNNAMVPVTVSVRATDDVDASPVCFLAAITSPGAGPDDSAITGTYTGLVRAVGRRTYSLKVTCMDSAANQRDGSVNVVVLPDTTAPKITTLSVAPSLIWPANGKMVTVKATVAATDDVDAAPVCGISSITATEPAAADAVITSEFTADVRAARDADGGTRIYTLHVSCSDAAGNAAEGTADVTISRDHPVKLLVRELSKRDRYVLANHNWRWLRAKEKKLR